MIGRPAANRILVAIALALIVGLAAVAGVSTLGSPRVRLELRVPTGGYAANGAIQTLAVVVTNDGGREIEPTFFVVLGPYAYLWAEIGPLRVAPGTNASYLLSAPCAECRIPLSADYIVRLFDPLTGRYAYSTAQRNTWVAGAVTLVPGWRGSA